MKYFVISLLFVLSSVAFAKNEVKPTEKSQGSATASELSLKFLGMDGCALLYDMNKKVWLEEFNPERCKRRHAPCSTFKVPLAVMAFDSGTLKDASTLFKWDKVPRSLDVWNQDHTAQSWMTNSVVWYSQEITKRMGRKKVQEYLTKFDYGNKDFSGGLQDAWLTPAPFSKNVKTSVLISAYEQISFLEKLWNQQLPVSEHAMKTTKEILLLETSPSGAKLYGKTGSGYVDFKQNKRLGWFIAVVEKGSERYLGVVTYNDLDPQKEPAFASGPAKKILKEILAEKGLF
ncbi:penicillin-binding transpeptidase domain-containing protein [Bdellovibrio bacteriovorus]|uniref:penicillin-binding transpeptidase domain-containing protein n=1 Tax=Bdellovibrio bacteriovorus TaxID=959 RepID=UPI0035A57B23